MEPEETVQHFKDLEQKTTAKNSETGSQRSRRENRVSTTQKGSKQSFKAHVVTGGITW